MHIHKLGELNITNYTFSNNIDQYVQYVLKYFEMPTKHLETLSNWSVVCQSLTDCAYAYVRLTIEYPVNIGRSYKKKRL